MANNQVSTLGIRIKTTGAEASKKAITGIGNTAKRVKSQVLSLNGALGALGAGAVARDIVKTASNLESLRVRLKFLTGSTQSASKAFDTMVGFAGRVPFALEEIQQASPSLLTITDSVDELNELLEITGDIAAVSGLSFQDTAMQIQRAMAGGIASADMFRERGVTAFLGFEAGVSYSADETKKKIIQMFRDGETTAKGATSELAKTFQGQVSMMQDAWFKLKVAIADSGVFELARDVVLDLTEYLGKPSTIENMKSFGNTVTSIGRTLKSIVESVLGLPTVVQEVGLIMYLFGGKRAKLIVGAVTGISVALDSMSQTMKQLKDQATDSKAPIQDFFDEFGVKEDSMPTAPITDKKVVNQFEANRPLNFTKKSATNIADVSKEVAKYRASLQKLMPTIAPLVKAERDMLDAQMKLHEEFDAGQLSQEGLANGLNNIRDAYKDVVSAVEQSKLDKKMEEITKSIEDGIVDSLMNIRSGMEGFKDAVKGIMNAVLSEIIRVQAAKPLAKAIMGFDWGSLLPGMASGGTVTGNTPYMVGEAGPELFVPSKTGTIVPNHSLGGGATQITTAEINFNVQAIDASSFNSFLINNKDTVEGIINNSLISNGSVRKTIQMTT